MVSLRTLTYNSHLFGSFIGPISGTGWKDDDRFDAWKGCVKNPDVCGVDLIAAQEIWSSDFVHTLEHGSVSSVYPYSFKSYHSNESTEENATSDVEGAPSNPSGLVMLGNDNAEIQTDLGVYINYIEQIGRTNFSAQDAFTGKGCYVVPVDVQGTSIVFATTHMPTNSHEYPTSLQECFTLLAGAISSMADQDGTSLPVILMGDFNLPETAGTISFEGSDNYCRYDEWIGPNGILGKIGLEDAYRTLYPSASPACTEAADEPGYSVIGSTNTCWRHFNREDAQKGDYSLHRIDYMMVRGMTPVSVAVQGMPDPGPDNRPDYSDTGNQWIWTDDGSTRDISDHYPVMGEFTIP